MGISCIICGPASVQFPRSPPFWAFSLAFWSRLRRACPPHYRSVPMDSAPCRCMRMGYGRCFPCTTRVSGISRTTNSRTRLPQYTYYHVPLPTCIAGVRQSRDPPSSTSSAVGGPMGYVDSIGSLSNRNLPRLLYCLTHCPVDLPPYLRIGPRWVRVSSIAPPAVKTQPTHLCVGPTGSDS